MDSTKDKTASTAVLAVLISMVMLSASFIVISDSSDATVSTYRFYLYNSASGETADVGGNYGSAKDRKSVV